MRNPDRFYSFTYHLADLWSKYCPDWRFAQLMSNFYTYYGSDLFYNEVAKNPDTDDFYYYCKEE